MNSHDQRLGKRVKVSYERPWTGFGPFDPIWKEGLFAGVGHDGYYVEFEDGIQELVEVNRVYFI